MTVPEEVAGSRFSPPDPTRIAGIVEKMAENGLDRLVIYFNGVHSFLQPNFVYWLSGFKPMGESMVILDANGNSTLIITPGWDYERAVSQAKAVNIIAADDLLAAFAKYVRAEMKFTFEQVGFIALEQMNVAGYHQVLSLLSRQIRQVTNEFMELTARKHEQEIEFARKATWIAERGYEKMLETARPGIYDYQLAGELVSYMKSLGADDNFLLMSASQHNQAVRPPGKRRLERGDIILAEISPSYRGQFSQICRTVVLGTANREQLTEKYHLLISAMESGCKEAKPGKTRADIFHAMNVPMEQAGYGEYCVPPYMRVRGHGLGLGSLLPGDVSGQNETILQEGMTFVIHPNQYIPETGYLLCGVPLLITSHGSETLSRRKPALDFIP